jgi:Asp-tRNA(Asn)/Glu-tRNA(Gln) amidotransferase A subunit family amidase
MDITDLDAHALSDRHPHRQVSCREVMQAYLARIHALNPRANAIVNLADDDDLLRQADERDASWRAGSRWAGCTACRRPSRTRATPRASPPPSARRC